MIKLKCGHCEAEFIPTARQAKRAKYEPEKKKYCSDICRAAAASARMTKPRPQYGPCPTCFQYFTSRMPKTFCSMKCYVQSPGFKQRIAENCRKGRERQGLKPVERDFICVECGVAFSAKRKRKFCSQSHYRQFMDKRFDRYIGSPQTLALPQNYDEFLTGESLRCLVEGCGWTGQALSNHMNFSHGVRAEDFKRAAGFNLSTGVIAAPLREKYEARETVGVGLVPVRAGEQRNIGPRVQRYRSKESAEHAAKGRALVLAEGGCPVRVCQHCEKSFVQSTPFGRAKFCNTECRDKLYRKQVADKLYECLCGYCTKLFYGDEQQKRRFERGSTVTCSIECRNKLNIKNSPNWQKAHFGSGEACA